jgi:hypothetical protein
MCILVDANVIPIVFSSKNKNHNKYKPLLKWIIFGKAKIVLGGYLYEKEMRVSLSNYTPLFHELSRLNKIHFFKSEDVNKLSDSIEKIVIDKDFDDPHLIALLVISRAKIFCSEDKRCFDFVKEPSFYPKGQQHPSIFTLKQYRKCLNLLKDSSICDIEKHYKLPQRTAGLFLDKYKL